MEVACGYDFGGIGKDDRVVDDRPKLPGQDVFHVIESVGDGTMDLWGAAQ